jgi:nucleoside-diphosphate-sugar epimerase
MTILILGKNGQLGTALVQALDGVTPIVALDRDGPGDLSKPDALCAYIRELKPKAIINAAAYTAVDKAEDEQDLAFLINGEAPAALALEAKDSMLCSFIIPVTMFMLVRAFKLGAKATRLLQPIPMANPNSLVMLLL